MSQGRNANEMHSYEYHLKSLIIPSIHTDILTKARAALEKKRLGRGEGEQNRDQQRGKERWKQSVR
jgi:hypothetical protein